MAKKKILVIDNEPLIIKAIEERMEPLGYEVISSCDGLQGVKLAESEEPDVILLDIIMPRIHGFEVCKELKKNRKTKEIPIIMMTAAGLEDIAEDEPEMQVEACIPKPFDSKKLVDIIRGVIEKHSKK